jgi:hypothetical protein
MPKRLTLSVGSYAALCSSVDVYSNISGGMPYGRPCKAPRGTCVQVLDLATNDSALIRCTIDGAHWWAWVHDDRLDVREAMPLFT